MGSEVSVEWAHVSVCFTDPSSVMVTTNLTPIQPVKLYRYSEYIVYFQIQYTKYLIDIDNITIVEVDSPDGKHQKLKVKLLLEHSDGLILHYPYQCDVCKSYYDYHIDEDAGTCVQTRPVKRSHFSITEVGYNHPTKKGSRVLSAVTWMEHDHLEVIKVIKVIKVFMIYHHIHYEMYLMYDDNGNHHVTRYIASDNYKVVHLHPNLMSPSDIDHSIHTQQNGDCRYTTKYSE